MVLITEQVPPPLLHEQQAQRLFDQLLLGLSLLGGEDLQGGQHFRRDVSGDQVLALAAMPRLRLPSGRNRRWCWRRRLRLRGPGKCRHQGIRLLRHAALLCHKAMAINSYNSLISSAASPPGLISWVARPGCWARL